MGRNKNQELNFLYLEDENSNASDDKKEKKVSKKKKVTKKERTTKNKTAQNENEAFNFDNEIVIGVTKLPNETQKHNVSKTKKKQNQETGKKTKKTQIQKGADKKSAPKKKQIMKKKEENKKGKIIKGVIKWTILLGALMAAFIFFMMSPLFNIVEISVTGNNAISQETITSLSGITVGENIYKTSKNKISQRIKQNAYIDTVEVNRILPNKVELQVKERTTTYMLEYVGSFVYINNQGYILEIATNAVDVPIIMGYHTTQEELKVGNRLDEEDLNKLEMVLKIIDSIQSSGIVSKINRINIENKQNYTLHIEEEKKIVYLGDASNLSSRMLYLKAVLNDTKGLEGEIFINGDLIKEKAVFRQKQ